MLLLDTSDLANTHAHISTTYLLQCTYLIIILNTYLLCIAFSGFGGEDIWMVWLYYNGAFFCLVYWYENVISFDVFKYPIFASDASIIYLYMDMYSMNLLH